MQNERSGLHDHPNQIKVISDHLVTTFNLGLRVMYIYSYFQKSMLS